MARRSQSWKSLERQAAHVLGGKRNPAAGGGGGPDVVGVPGWCVECKLRATFAHDTMYRQERAKRRGDLRNGTRFALITRARGRSPLVVLSLADFAELVGAFQEARSGSQEAAGDVLSGVGEMVSGDRE